MQPGAVTPEQALALVRALSTDVLTAAVRDDAGNVLAGRAPAPERALVARSGGLEMALELGPHALRGLAQHDAEAALAWITRPQRPR